MVMKIMVPFLEVHIKGDMDIDVDIDTDSSYGWLSKLWFPFGSLNARCRSRLGPKMGPEF